MLPPRVLRWLWISLGLHLLTAHFSRGYYHPDEHFQILEFLNYKLELSPASDLPWEFSAHIRPWLQPALFTGLTRFWRALGITSPIVWAELFRILAGLLAWTSQFFLILRCKDWLQNDTRKLERVAMLFALMWWIPFVHVRTSSESFSSSFFYLGLVALTAPSIRGAIAFWGGLALGLAFECRFQTGFLIAGLATWLLFIKKISPKVIALSLGGFALAFALGRWCDYWGYGGWTFSPWNYLHANIFENKAAQWGTDPWWGYLYLVGKLLPPLSVLALFSVFGFWWKAPRNPLTWATLPFFFIHCLVAHKEARFLIPMFWALPVMLEIAWGGGSRLNTLTKTHWGQSLIFLLILINVGALGVLSLAPARTEFVYLEHIYKTYPEGLRVYWWESDPSTLAGGLQVNFLKHPGSEATHLKGPEEFSQILAHSTEPVYFFHTQSDILDLLPATGPRCERVFSSLSDFERRWLPARTQKKMRIMNLFKCTPGA